MEVPKVYNPELIEDKWYQFWLDQNFFRANVNKNKKPYTIVIPPPNVTSILHMGHAFNNTIQDIYIRFKRKQGYETLWQPGTDHAGIATQNVVEKSLAQKNISRHDLGREKFIEKVWEWREKYGSTIIHQLKKLGCSCDWSRERFTMEEDLSSAVKEVFIRLYEKGLIYKGKYIINWCPRCSTALSDEEVEHKEIDGHLWYFKYPFKNNKDFLVVATTRPETMLGDTAVAVHPNDKRYKHFIGKTVILPLMNREIPVIADEMVDPEFGTGCVKVTPAHDPNDFLIGERQNLKQVNIMQTDGTLNENAGDFSGLDRFVARNKIIQEMEKRKLTLKVISHHHNVGHCHRCHTIIEPYLSEQWFVRVTPLAQPALAAVKEGKIHFHPHDRWYRTYEHWMENVKDWCISRQLWWGHRIPVYYCEQCSEMMVARDQPSTCPKCESNRIHQDEDVLDTWFSSWLWPFSTLGWPKKNEDLNYFYPTDLLVTGPDIIFFWVARMIMAGIEFTDDIPFRDVLLNGIVRDEKGRKMSKSLGNGIDPVEMIDKYSADAVRFTLIMLSSEGQDINLSPNHFEMGRNFSNKIWNAYRFLAMNMEGVNYNDQQDKNNFELADRWILSRLQKTIKNATLNLDHFRVNESLSIIYHFFWHDYCDWYLELIKNRLYQKEDKKKRETAMSIAIYIMKIAMDLLHPFIPFISEEIWQSLQSNDQMSVVTSSWPVEDNELMDETAEREMLIIQEAIGTIRNIRAEMNIPPGKTAPLFIRSEKKYIQLFKKYIPYFTSLAKVDSMSEYSIDLKKSVSASAVIHGIELFIPLEKLIDLNKERARLEKEIQRLENLTLSFHKKLNNENFRKKAPEKIVQAEIDKARKIEDNLEKIKKNYGYLFKSL
jgi:valyl-tRNA synthetase